MKVIYEIRGQEVVLDDVVSIKEVTRTYDIGFFIWRYKDKEDDYTFVAADLIKSIEVNKTTGYMVAHNYNVNDIELN